MTENSRIVPLAGVKNFRDMGGYKARDGRMIKWGHVFRSGHLSDMTGECGMELMARDIETVIDFRSGAEKERHPVRWPQSWSPNYYPLPIGGNAAAWVHKLFETIAESPFPAKDLRDQFILAFETIPVKNADGLKAFFDTMIDHHKGGAVLFHCTAGKDRTGIAGALLMRALGMQDDDIMADFLMTNEAVDLEETSAMVAGRLSSRAGRTIAPKDVLPLVGVEEDFLHAAFHSIGREYGSVEDYLVRTLGLEGARLDRLKTLFLAG
jgi:protein-tyrosine phosphatase